ncbi:FKBP-type peptidyl-prolyl cis-trans isomerase N-terminal domain-containing protein [Serratia proteamaculans]
MIKAWSVTARTLLLVPLCFVGAATAAYTPPEPLSSVDVLARPQQDNGYGLGALIESQQQKERAEKDRGTVPVSVSAAAAAARQAQSARRQTSALQAEIAGLKAQLAAGRRDDQQLASSESARATLAADKTALQQQLEIQQAKERSAAEHLVTSQQALKERDGQLRVQQGQLDALQSQLTLNGDNQKQLSARTAELAASQSALAALRAKPAGPQADLTTAGGKQDYVVGQSIAANLRERLQSYTSAGLTLDQQGVLAGISDGLKGSMQMKKADMDATYLQFATKLQQQVGKQVSDGEALIARKSRGRTPVKQVDGITYFVVKKGKAITDPDAPVMLSLTEAIADGRTVSQLPQLVLTVTDEMPAVVREALPLLGEGSEVQAYALAKSVYGSLPLPRGVEAFTVLSYDLKGLTPPRPAKKMTGSNGGAVISGKAAR